MTPEDRVTHAREMRSDLRRLIEALDRRVPRLERAGEGQIASDAAELRDRASDLIKRIDESVPEE